MGNKYATALLILEIEIVLLVNNLAVPNKFN